MNDLQLYSVHLISGFRANLFVMVRLMTTTLKMVISDY